jgi:hypothetical protein
MSWMLLSSCVSLMDVLSRSVSGWIIWLRWLIAVDGLFVLDYLLAIGDVRIVV